MKVDKVLTDKGVPHDVIPHRDTYDAQRMAQTLHVSGREVAKTVLLRADGGGAYVVAVLPANRTIDFERARAALGAEQVELANELELAEHCPDCELGALPPFGSHYGMKTIVDQSLAEDEQIVFEGNTHHEAIRMRFADFQQLENPALASFVHPS